MSARVDQIVIINDTSMPKGGAGLLAVELAKRLAAQGEKIVIFAGDDGRNPVFEEAGFDVVAIDGRPLLASRRAGLVNGLYNRKAKAVLARWIAENDTPHTVYHIHGWSQILSPSIFAALRPVAARAAITAHDFFLACPNGNYTIYPKSMPCPHAPLSVSCLACNCDKRSYAQKLWRVARQFSVNGHLHLEKFPFTILAIQANMISFLERGGVPADRIAVLPNPAERTRGARVRAEKNRDFFFLGRIEPEKGADLLAAAARKANVPVRIIGEGPDEARVRRANPEARFEGWKDRGEIDRLLAEARALVMSSRCMEPFGLAAAEALKAGVPVAASETALISSDLEALGMGRAVDVFDTDSFAAVLAALSKDDALIAAMSEKAFENAGNIALSHEEWTDRHLQLYQQFVAPAHAPSKH